MVILTSIFLSFLHLITLIIIHLLLIHIFNLKKISSIFIPFILANFLFFFLLNKYELTDHIIKCAIINFSILIIYVEFLFLINTGFTLAIIASFKNKKKLTSNDLQKNYSNKKGAKWILLNRIQTLFKLNILKSTKKIKLKNLGYILTILIIATRKILTIKNLG
jgi:hypothetical protein|tara:strand:- start:28 stop:519 length:492 start_codon:yes stop_codon:yes gene_type:complete